MAQNARSLEMLEKWSCGHAVYGNWMEERIGGWPAVGGEKTGLSCIHRVRPRSRRRHRDRASGVHCILPFRRRRVRCIHLALSRLVRCSRRGRRQPCWRIGVL